jgi:hypothetical protein
VITVEPVVVNPDIDSKNASVNVGTAPESKYGIDPKKTSAIHTLVVMTKACRVDIPCDVPLAPE